jgi:hypothetical protein
LLVRICDATGPGITQGRSGNARKISSLTLRVGMSLRRLIDQTLRTRDFATVLLASSDSVLQQCNFFAPRAGFLSGCDELIYVGLLSSRERRDYGTSVFTYDVSLGMAYLVNDAVRSQ